MFRFAGACDGFVAFFESAGTASGGRLDGAGGDEKKRGEERREEKGGGEGKGRGKRGPGPQAPASVFKNAFLPPFPASFGVLLAVLGIYSPRSSCW